MNNEAIVERSSLLLSVDAPADRTSLGASADPHDSDGTDGDEGDGTDGSDGSDSDESDGEDGDQQDS